MAAALALSMALVSCGKEDRSDSSSSYGYAPSSLPSGQWLSIEQSYLDFSDGSVRLTQVATGLGYTSFSGTPSLGYTKTASNSATLSWNATLVNDGRWNSSHKGSTYTTSGKVTLFFISPSEGYASGTMNGSSVSNRQFTLL